MKFVLAATACLTAFPAVAQTSPTADPAPAPASGDGVQKRVDTIVVTARRRDEDLQTVPAAVSVLSGDLLDKNYITAMTIQTGNSGLIQGQPSDPRMMGVTVSAQY